MTSTSRFLVWVAAALGAALCGCEQPVPRAEIAERLDALERPHLVLVVVDTLRADSTTPYDPSRDTSPELARWADHGAIFERARAQSSWTKISMASLFTSLWPRSHAIREPTDALAEGAVTLAELLREAGYRTYAVQTNGWLDQSFGFQQGFERYVFPRGTGAKGIKATQIWPHADRVLEEAGRLIDAHDPKEPLFLYLHLMDVHEYASPPEFKTYGDDDRGAYLSAVRWDDDALERIRVKLDRAGLLDRSVLVFASDHGEAFGENGKQGHARNVFTSTLSTPLVIRFPFAVDPIRVRSQVRNIDIAPTLLELAGIPIPDLFEGRSLIPLVTSQESETDRITYAALGLPLYRDASVQVSVNDGIWTYARNVDPDPIPGEFLFDRSIDPGENVNLIEREPEAAARMRKLMDAHLATGPVAGVRETDVRIDPSIAEKLRAMGYLQ